LDQPKAQESSSKLQEITEAAKQNLSDEEFQKLEKLIAEYDDIFAVGSVTDVGTARSR
jgi:predicted negative regulator of RcsB-dependent stress response